MLTRHRDLRTGTTYWQSRPMPRVPSARLQRDVETDVLVVGAGISGALVAEALSERHRVVIIDRRGPVKGSTAASTALVEYEIDTPLTVLTREIGAADAARAWRRSHLALQALSARTRALGVPCDQMNRDTLYLAGNVLDATGLKEERDARRSIGLETDFLSRAALRDRFGIERAAALLSHGDFVLDPRRLTAGYLRAAVARGARLHAPVEVMGVKSHGGGVMAFTKDGPAISAHSLIFATGYEVPKLIPQDGHRIVSTYAIATRPQRRNLWPGEALVWEASDPYLYVRTTADGRVICGGEDEDFADEEKRDALIDAKAAALGRKLHRLFPALDVTPQYRWAGSFGTTETGLPLIGPVPHKPHCWAVLGFGGNGITYSRIAADIISAALSGRADSDADLYRFR
ncbi:MAG TPA: FAD-dependent oxidoreductase [Bauldia sp.]|nr:FAD-dependent oxidoreductase [Bauldia sp.]